MSRMDADSVRALEAVIAAEAEQRAADQLRTVQNLLDKAMRAESLKPTECALLARTSLALHERLEARARRLRGVPPLTPSR